MDWYPWSIYNVYFDNDSINNNSDAIINSVLVGMLEVKCKYNMEGVKQKKKLLIWLKVYYYHKCRFVQGL